MKAKVFAYIWEYIVKEDYLLEFKKIYGLEGDWVKLFRKADGYIKTDLHQDALNTSRFLTIDYWETKESRDNFREQYLKEFELLDQHCENFTEQEKFVGDFNLCTNRL